MEIDNQVNNNKAIAVIVDKSNISVKFNFILNQIKLMVKFSNDLNFREIGYISLENSNLTILNSLNIFTIFLVKNELTPISISQCSSIKNDLFKTLFYDQDNNSLSLIIGTNDGQLYSIEIDGTKHSSKNEAKLMLNTNSPIIYVSSMFYRNPIDLLLKSNEKIKKSSNILFTVTNSGKIFIYQYSSKYNFQVAIVPHYLKTCIKHNGRLYYATTDNKIFYFELDRLFDKNIQPIFIKKARIEKFEVNESKELYGTTKNGYLIKLKEIFNTSSAETKQENITKNHVNESIDKLCSFSNRIVNTQLNIDNLNLTLKQMNQFKSLERQDGFEILTKIDSLNSNIYLSILIKNKAIKLECNLKSNEKSEYQAFSLLVCLKFFQNNDESFWYHKLVNFTALNPKSDQNVNIPIEDYLRKNLKLGHILLYLVFDLNRFLLNYENMNLSRPSEFSICIYEKKLSFVDLLTPAPLNTHVNDSMFISMLKKFSQQNINQLWSSIKVENLKQDSFFYGVLKGKFYLLTK